MKIYRSLFYNKKPVIKITAAIYSAMLIVLVVFISTNFGTITADSYLIIGFLIISPYTLFMLLRSLYLIFETTRIDEEKKEISFSILRKNIAFSNIKGIKIVRPGQMRIETTEGIYPFSVEQEEEFITTIKRVSPATVIH